MIALIKALFTKPEPQAPEPQPQDSFYGYLGRVHDNAVEKYNKKSF